MLADLHWPGAETQLWMAAAGAGAAAVHWLYYSVWLRVPEWTLLLRELRGHRVGFAERVAIERDRSWVVERKLEKNGPLASLQLGLLFAAGAWMMREVPVDMGRWLQEAIALGVAVLAYLRVHFVDDREMVGAPPKEVEEEEPSGWLEEMLGKKRARLVHIAIAAAMLVMALRLF